MAIGRQGSFGLTVFLSFAYGFASFVLVINHSELKPLYEHDFLSHWLLAPLGAFCGFMGATWVHELAHFFAALFVGGHVHKIQIGSGKVLGTFRLMGTACEVHESLRSGLVLYSITSAKRARMKLAFVTGAAPLASLLLAGVSIALLIFIWPLDQSASSIWYYPFPYLVGWTLPCVLFLPGVLLPYRYQYAGRKMETDAMRLLAIPWLTDAEIEKRISAAQTLLTIRDEIDPSTISLDQALERAEAAPNDQLAVSILALFEQSWADETNGRASWRSLPFWGGGSDNPARNYRGQLADAFGKSTVSSTAALPSALWLIGHEMVEDSIASGAQVLSRIHGAEADAAIGTLLQEPHPSQQVLITALHEAAARHLVQNKASVIALEQSYRPAVRKEAQAAAIQLGEPHAQEYDRTAPLPPIMVDFLKTNSERLLATVPDKAVWQEGQVYSLPMQGWLLNDSTSNVTLLTWFAQENSISKQYGQLKSGNLQDAANELVARRAELTALQASANDNEDNWQKARAKRAELSRRGMLSAQFEPAFISLPEITVAIWCWQHGDLDSCRRILDGCYSSADDDRWIDLAARDYFGDIYNREMVEKFCDDEDDAATLRLAQHLSKPIFDGYGYQDRAKELTAQLTRKDSADNVSLPPLPVWWVWQAFLSRDQQITYLAKRLKLLHTAQDN